MTEKNGKSPLVAISAMVALFAALGVIVYTQVPFKGVRPSVTVIPEPSQKIRARLWEDPFRAVMDQIKTKDLTRSFAAGRCILNPPAMMKRSNLKDEITGYLGKGKVTVLGVMVFGGPYAEDMEGRLRQRYAVLSALGQLKFIPKDSDYIGFFRVFQTEAEARREENQVSLPTIMPFEWLVSDDQKASVLLLWINDDVFFDTPLAKLAALITFLSPGDKNLSFKILGPAGSTRLLEMAKELQQGENLKNAAGRAHLSSIYSKLKGLEIYSATATASDSILHRELQKNHEGVEAKSIEAQFRDWKIQPIIFKRTICSDEVLAKTLMEELKLRGVEPQDHIVLVAEWDTFYGRALPQTFIEVREQKDGDGSGSRVYRYSYLRGIDGKLPGDRDPKADKGAKDEDGGKANGDLQKTEEPQGKSQYDYLRRLAEEIHLLKPNPQRDQKPGSIKAIGVLGSDFYDKYLVLQALGQRFPDKIFFTTDLDARLLHPANIKWTRNLVVASGFGLQLREDLQGEVPPFRDCYQASVFLATLRAFGGRALLEKDKTEPLKPRIFEIGRRHAIDLSPRDPVYETVNEVLPARDMPYLGSLWLFLLICLLSVLAGLVLLSCVADKKQLVQSTWQFITHNLTIVLPGIFGLLMLALIIIYFYKDILNFPLLRYLKDPQNFSEEPFSLTEGVSVWPAAIIRLIALGLAWFFLGFSVARLKNNRNEIEQEFRLGPCSQPAKPDPRGRLTDQTGRLNMDRLWEDYVSRGAFWRRVGRFVPIMLVYIGICGWIIVTFGEPTTPVRGYISSILNRSILGFTVLSFLILTFFVFDATMLCRGLVTLSLGQEPEWSPESVAAFKGRVGPAQEGLNEWMLIRLIAERTKVVGKLIFYPFIVWFILFLSRLPYFDNWRTPIGLAIVISMSALLTWGCGLMLRRSAEKLRSVVVERLSKQLIQVHWHDPLGQEPLTRIQFVLNEVKSAQTGAFAPYLQQPWVQALVLPFGGIGGMHLIDFLINLT